MDEHVAAEYARSLGELLANFHALEYQLRTYLYEHAPESFVALPMNLDWYRVSAGDLLPLNALTSFDSLGELIKRYNGLVAAHAPESQVDTAIVRLRDALVHGRVSVPPDRTFPVLLKFDRPINGTVRVTDAHAMTPAWLAEQSGRIWEQISVVHTQWQRDR